MKQSMTTRDIARQLNEDENASFSWSGALTLAEYLEDLEDDMGEEMEFDGVAIRCDFSEYESLVEWAEDYFTDWKDDLDIEEEDDEDDIDEKIREYINDNGTLIEFDGGIIVSSF